MMKKINKSVIVMMIVMALLLVFGYQLLQMDPFAENDNYEPRYHQGEVVKVDHINNEYILVYANADNSFVGIEIENQEANQRILIAQKECFDYYLQNEGTEYRFEYNGIPIHIDVKSYQKSLFTKQYTALMNVYHDDHYIHYVLSDSEYKELDFTNEKQIKEVA